MIAYLKGEVVAVSEENLVLEVNQIGYNVKISTSTANLLPSVGETVKIYTYTYVREDAFQLFGFLTKDDLEMFKLVITVNGIGPKGGLAILSTMNSEQLRYAILAGDAKAISKAPGIGGKTAERLLLDLRDKVSLSDLLTDGEEQNSWYQQGNALVESSAKQEAKKEAIEALTALGYSASDALRAVNKVAIEETMNAEIILKQALKAISFI